MNYLGKKGYTIFKKDYDEKRLNVLRNDLNIKPYSTHSVIIKEYPIYRESSTKIYLPRYYGIENFGDFNNTVSKGKDIDLKFVGQLYDYQCLGFS